MSGGFVAAVRRAWRLPQVTAHLVLGIVLVATMPLLGRRRSQHIVHVWSGRLLRIIGVRALSLGASPTAQGTPLVIAANHISWVDIFAIDAVRTTRFVAKSEVRSWPVLGWLAARTGTLFIERGRRHHAAAINDEIGAAIDGGDTVGLFPEGTTTHGDELRPFHTALFQAAVAKGMPIVPVALRYYAVDGSRSKAAPYVGETSFVESLWTITGAPWIRAEVEFGQPIPTAGRTRREVSNDTSTAISRMLYLPDRHRTPETAPGLEV